MLRMMVVEDNLRMRDALTEGLEATDVIQVVFETDNGEAALDYCLRESKGCDVILMDVSLAGVMNGIEVAVSIRREYPRMPVVFYSIQDDDDYYRAFLEAGILSHYAYVRKSNYLLPGMLLPLLKDAAAGRNFVDPEIEARVQDVRHRDRHAPMSLLETNEQTVARLLAAGMTNEQIASRMGFRDKRTISRTNGQIYAAWNLVDNTTDEKVARTRAAIIVHSGRLIHWDEDGLAFVMDASGQWVAWDHDV